MREVDQSWSAVVASLPVHLRTLAGSLTHQLNLASAPGGSWHEYTQLEPMYDLPVFVCEDRESVRLFRHAHHCAGFHGLVMDRRHDGQARDPDALEEMEHALRAAWQRSLGDALEDNERATEVVGHALSRWRDGLRLEGETRRAGAMSQRTYARYVDAKCEWLLVSATTCASRRCAPEASHAFQRSVRVMTLALQLLDDTLDEEEDRRRDGSSVPERLQAVRDGLLCTAVSLLQHAAGEAQRGGFARLSRWQLDHAATVDRHVRGDRVAHALTAIALAPSMVQSLPP